MSPRSPNMIIATVIIGLYVQTVCCSLAADCSETQHQEESCPAIDSDCYLFLAPSSIEGAGMGIFSTKKFREGSTILSSDYGPLIPISDSNAVHDHWIGLWNNYIWGHHSAASDQLWYEAETVTDFQPGLGIFPNFHTYLMNLGCDQPPGNITYHASEGPGAGAVSSYVGRIFKANRDINAGDELFLDYGNQYLDDRSPDMDFVPRSSDFEMAAGVVKSISAEIGLDDISGNKSGIPRARVEKILHLLSKSLEDTFPRVTSLLPRNFEELKKVIALGKSIEKTRGNSEDRSPFGIALAKSNLVRRDVQWIKDNGICLDNIKAGESVIPYAGRGAKARRPIIAGELIVPLPLLHVQNQREFNMYRVHTDQQGNFIRDRNERIGNQLLLNYCFGSRHSSLLLCPVTNGILTNHCSPPCKRPNAEIRWGKDATTKKWLNLSLSEVTEKKERGLTMELIAIRDIEIDEEIFIEYGDAWVNAWNEHVEKWANGNVGERAGKASDHFTACYYWEEDNDDEDNSNTDPNNGIDWTTLRDSEFLKIFSSDGSKFRNQQKNGSYWPCSILKLEANGLIVRIFQSMWHDTTQWETENIPRILSNYPKDSVSTFFKPYKSPLHDRSSFRHFVDLPPGFLPNQWLDKNSSRSESLEEQITEFKSGDRVEIWDEVSGSWVTGTIIKGRRFSVLLDGSNLIETRVPLEHLRWPTQLLQAAASQHPFY